MRSKTVTLVYRNSGPPRAHLIRGKEMGGGAVGLNKGGVYLSPIT